MATTQTILLNRFQFCHVQDQNLGVITLHEGPGRVQLESHQALLGTWEKIKVPDRHFAVVHNPYRAEQQDIAIGEREIRIGPKTFSLHPGEEVGEIKREYTLSDQQGLLLRADKNVSHPDRIEETFKVGTEILIRGPRRFIPPNEVTVIEERSSIRLSENDGIYVQNKDSGVLRLVRGPQDFFLEHDESLWEKKLTDEEQQALGYVAQKDIGKGARVLASLPRIRSNAHEAVVINLENNEVVCLLEGNCSRVEFGPQVVFLMPNERPKVLFISGDVPVRPNVLRVAKLGLGPDFIRDRLMVRTNDNATLDLNITFRWRFIVSNEHPDQLFALKDFVGFAAQCLASEIREQAAHHSFEDFHSRAAELVKRAIFHNEASRIFTENGLEIFGVDVESVVPTNEEIQSKLSEAIKANVDIYTRRVKEESELDSERRLIEGRKHNEIVRRELIQQIAENERTKKLAEAETAKLAQLVLAQSEADSVRIRAQADLEAETLKMRTIAEILETEGGSRLIELERARVLKATDKVVVPTSSKLVLGLSDVIP
jgi:major vault protein